MTAGLALVVMSTIAAKKGARHPPEQAQGPDPLAEPGAEHGEAGDAE